MSVAGRNDLVDVFGRLSAEGLVRRLLEIARDEDLGPSGRDLTGELLGEDGGEARAVVASREAGIVAGLAAVPELLEVFEAGVEVDMLAADGTPVGAGDGILRVSGSLREIVRIERTLLNLLGRLSGVATRTARFREAMGDGAGRVELLDTRKTTPGLRVLEKYAVVCGGGASHRLGLHDAVLIKDNHIAGLSDRSLAAWLAAVAGRARESGAAFVEIEVDTLDQLAAVLSCPAGTVDFVLLDNMPTERLREAAAMRDSAGSSIRLEASGGVTLETIGAIAATGIDRISVGSLTHAARSLDLGMDR